MKRGKFFKKLLSMVLTSGMLFATLAGTAGAAGMGDFTDVSPKDWYYEAVEYAVENKLFSGTSSTEFSPETPMDRGMFVTVLGRLAGVRSRPGKPLYRHTLWGLLLSLHPVGCGQRHNRGYREREILSPGQREPGTDCRVPAPVFPEIRL